VLKHTLITMINPKPDNLVSLISINRELAAGLLSGAPDSVPSAAKNRGSAAEAIEENYLR
jgi:hypothetical protein